MDVTEGVTAPAKALAHPTYLVRGLNVRRVGAVGRAFRVRVEPLQTEAEGETVTPRPDFTILGQPEHSSRWLGLLDDWREPCLCQRSSADRCVGRPRDIHLS